MSGLEKFEHVSHSKMIEIAFKFKFENISKLKYLLYILRKYKHGRFDDNFLELFMAPDELPAPNYIGDDGAIIFCENIEIVVVVLAALIWVYFSIHHLDRFSFNLLK